MRIVHIAVYKLLSLLVLAAGVLLIAMYFQASLFDRVTEFAATYWEQLAPVGGALLLILGLLGLLPLSRRKRPSTISFPGEYGEVTIHLDSIEATLNRIVSKMPEVKKISVRLIPSEDNRRAEVTGSLWIYKGSEAVGVSEIVGKVQKHLRDTAINILGVEEIVMGKLDVPGIIVSASTAKPAPVAEKEAAPVPVAATPATVPAVRAEETEVEAAEEELAPVETDDEPATRAAAFEPAEVERAGEEPLAWRPSSEEEERH